MPRRRNRYIRILVIDDEPDMLLFAKAFLTMHMPHIVRVHTTSHIEWEKVVTVWDEVAVAIVDLMMPTPGIDILREIQEKYPHVDRVAWTAAADSIGQAVEEEGLAIVIPKPDHEELRSYVLRMVGG